jgi:hypothetical protein
VVGLAVADDTDDNVEELNKGDMIQSEGLSIEMEKRAGGS